jgi:hypothetical protein
MRVAVAMSAAQPPCTSRNPNASYCPSTHFLLADAVVTNSCSLAACSSGRRAGWAVRRFDSLVLSEVPGVVLGMCAQGEGTFLHIARYEALLAPRIGAQPLLANRSPTTWGSGGHLKQ